MPELEQPGVGEQLATTNDFTGSGKFTRHPISKTGWLRNISQSHTSNSLASFLRLVRRSCQNKACKERGRLQMNWKKTSIFQGIDNFLFYSSNAHLHTFLMKEYVKQTAMTDRRVNHQKQMFLWQLQPQQDLPQQTLPGIQGVVLPHCCM